MMYSPIGKFLEAISPLTNEEFDYILSHFILKKFKKHAFLIQEGDAVNMNITL